MNTKVTPGMSRTTGRMLTRREHIEQSIDDILTTPVGTRVMRRDYGSIIADLLGRPVDSALICKLYAATVIPLAIFLPMIHVVRVGLSQPVLSGSLALSIVYVDKESQQQHEYIFAARQS